MKLLSRVLAASVLSVALAGCTSTYDDHHVAVERPGIRLDSSHPVIMVGETTTLVAHTTDMVGSNKITWKVSPDVGKITQDKGTGQTAFFMADQAGMYYISAAVQRADGTWLTSPEMRIDVRGRVSTERY